MKDTCCLCHQPFNGDRVPFGSIFYAHVGCAHDWHHEQMWEEEQRQDRLEYDQ
jgi:hypothetical protein